jgi:hypothetical protein
MTKEEKIIYMRNWRKENPDKCKEYTKRWFNKSQLKVNLEITYIL